MIQADEVQDRADPNVMPSGQQKEDTPRGFRQFQGSKFFDGITLTLPYTNQRNAWFDRYITRWLINNVLFPYNDEQHVRGVPCIILFDNFSAQKLSDEEFSALEERNFFICFLPPNITSKNQPADMGMIASLKVGYKTLMINQLLDLFDEEGGFKLSGERRN